jgi:predicted acylesterase/phospholipase RssA
MVKNINIDNLFTHYGIDNGSKLEIILKCLVRNKLKVDDITLYNLYKKTLKTNTIITTCLNDKKCIYLNHLTYPNLNIITALLMTSCIPLYFNPIKYNEKYYIDGCVLNHFGIDFFETKDNTIFGVLLNENKNTITIDSFELYISNMIELILTNTSVKYYTDNTILVIDYIYSVLNFNISSDDKKKMIQIGYEKAYLFFKKNN